jgi:hypothetical protein
MKTINHNRIPVARNDTMIFHRGSLACRQASLRCGDSLTCRFRHHTPNPQSSAAQLTQNEDHTSHEQSTRVSFGTPPEKGQEPLTITTIRAGEKHLPPFDDPRCTKRSRWRQPSRETSESCSETQSPSAFRCNHLRNALGFTSNLIKMMNL